MRMGGGFALTTVSGIIDDNATLSAKNFMNAERWDSYRIRLVDLEVALNPIEPSLIIIIIARLRLQLFPLPGTPL